MARHTGPKSKLSRRAGVRLFPKDERIFTKRNYPPGMHGQNRRRFSGYGQRLLEKQKAKWAYGLMERQFRKYYDIASTKPEQTGLLLMQILEKRLDNVVYRLGFAASRPQARQLVNHGFFSVNGKKVSIPSFATKPGDVIAVLESKGKNKYFQNLTPGLLKYQAPAWLELIAKELKGKIVVDPQVGDLDGIINPQLIIEYYSR